MLDPIKFPEPTRCAVCHKPPFYDILTRDTVGDLMAGRCNTVVPKAVVQCCTLKISSWNLTSAIAYWNANNVT